MTALGTAAEYAAWIAAPAAAIWFTAPACGICAALGPRVEALFAASFPRIPLATIDTGAHPEMAAQASVFTAPTLAVFFDGHEFVRKSRHFSVAELARELERPYLLWLGAAQ